MTNRLHGLLVDPDAHFPPPPSTACSSLPQGCLRIQDPAGAPAKTIPG